jgi:hypothetical protein
LDEQEIFARERGSTGFDVRGDPRRRETVRQLCDEAGRFPGVSVRARRAPRWAPSSSLNWTN